MSPRASLAIATGFALAAGLAAAKADDVQRPTGPAPSITVEGHADRDVAPDMAVISIGVTTTKSTAQEAAQQNGKTAKAIIDAAKADGVAEADIATVEASLSPVYDRPKDGAAPQVRAFQATNRLAIKVRKLDTTAALAGHLLDQGANDLQGIDFTIADPEPLLDSVRTQAAQQARHQAEVYAKAIGQKLGRVLTIRPEGGAMPIMARAMKVAAPAAAAAPVALASGTQRLEARVSITWALEDAQP